MSDWGQPCLYKTKTPRHIWQNCLDFSPLPFLFEHPVPEISRESWVLFEEVCGNEGLASFIWFWTKRRAKSWAIKWDQQAIRTSSSQPLLPLKSAIFRKQKKNIWENPSLSGQCTKNNDISTQRKMQQCMFSTQGVLPSPLLSLAVAISVTCHRESVSRLSASANCHSHLMWSAE